MLTKFGKGRHRGRKKSGNTGIVPSFIPDSFSNYISDTGKLQILYLCSLQSKLKLKKGVCVWGELNLVKISLYQDNCTSELTQVFLNDPAFQVLGPSAIRILFSDQTLSCKP